jgi:hypothetical protein
MDFHHSNGFNYVRAAIEQRLPIWMSRNGKHQLAANTSASAGLLFTWTDFTFFGDRYLNKLHLSGVGMSLTAGLRFEFFKYFFIQGQAQCGWSGLTNIQLMTVSNRGLPDQKDARGRQNISFMERSWAVGAYFPIGRKK